MKKPLFAAAAVFLSLALSPAWVSASAETDYRFQRVGDIGYTSVSAAQVLESCYGPLGEAERAFLDENADFSLAYSGSIGASHVKVSEREEGDPLAVSAEPYSYTAVNGEEVVWTPVRADLGGKPLEKTASGWAGEVADQDGDVVTVTYQTSFSIAASDVDSFLNEAYFAGMGASESIHAAEERYRAEMAEYDAADRAYQTYLAQKAEYDAARAEYEAYLSEHAAWEKQNAAYAAYRAAYEEYLAAQAEYDNYQNTVAPQYEQALADYRQYRSDYADYERKLAEYEANTSSAEARTALYHLSVLSYLTKPVTNLNRTLSGSILGNSVTQVLGQTEALVAAGASREVVELANVTTINLRRLLNQYLLCGSDEARYAYYITCHADLSKQFNEILRCLDYLYHDFQAVRGAIRKYDRTEQFEILLAQLYYLCNALDDGQIGDYHTVYGNGKTYFDDSYRIGVGALQRKPSEILGADGVLEDRDCAEPLTGGYPNLPARPQPPAPVKDPGARPARPPLPEMPDPVEEPAAEPEAVNEPTMPEEVPQPSLPQEQIFSESEHALAAAFESGELYLRERPQDALTFSAETTVDKYFRNAKWVTVRFYADESREVLLDTVDEAPLGSYLEYNGPLPEREERGYSCVFEGWADEDGNPVDVNRLDTEKSELDLFPVFRKIPLQYSVVWSVDGRVIRTSCAYGSIPQYDEEAFGPLAPERADGRPYRFIGWQCGDNLYREALPEMTDEAVRYTAVFETGYLITFSVAGTEYTVPVWEGEIADGGTPTREADSVYCYEFLGWDRDVLPAHADATYTARFSVRRLVSFEGGGGGTVERTENGYVADCTAASGRAFSPDGLLPMAAEEGVGVEVRLAGSSLFMSPETVAALAECGGGSFSVEIVQTSAFTYRYRLIRSAETPAETLRYTFSASGSFDGENSYLYDVASGEEVGFTFADAARTVRFEIRENRDYELVLEYAVAVIESPYASVSPSRLHARAGERVEIAVGDFVAGMYLGSLYAVADDGRELPIDGASFVMPDCAVSVGIVGAYYTYTVVFRVDGKTIATRTYRYGEEIVPPENPVKPSDGVSAYTFEGWDKPLGAVTGDAVYEAVFRVSPLPPVEIPDSTLNKIIRAAYYAVPIFLAVLLAVIVLIVVLCVRKRRKKRAANREKNQK